MQWDAIFVDTLILDVKNMFFAFSLFLDKTVFGFVTHPISELRHKTFTCISLRVKAAFYDPKMFHYHKILSTSMFLFLSFDCESIERRFIDQYNKHKNSQFWATWNAVLWNRLYVVFDLIVFLQVKSESSILLGYFKRRIRSSSRSLYKSKKKNRFSKNKLTIYTYSNRVKKTYEREEKTVALSRKAENVTSAELRAYNWVQLSYSLSSIELQF